MKTREIDYIVWKEGSYYISRCLNVEVSSFGNTMNEAVKNFKEAVELFFEGEEKDYQSIKDITFGRVIINA